MQAKVSYYWHHIDNFFHMNINAMVNLYYTCQKNSIRIYFEIVNLNMHMTTIYLCVTYKSKISMDKRDNNTSFNTSHRFSNLLMYALVVATPLWARWEDETPIPKVGDLESSETPECLEFDNKGQNTLHWGVLGVIGKVLKCVQNCLALVIWTSAAQVMGKRRARSQIGNLTPDH
jgi:hypothetical protein